MAQVDDAKQVGLGSGQELMANGPHALYDFIASKLETALGRALPQMEIRVHDLSLTAEIVVTEAKSEGKAELPTLANVVKKAFVPNKTHTVRKEILKNVSAVFKPGTITLMLGQPGSGKSSLMTVLSGRFPMTKNIKMDGQITFNGQDLTLVRKVLPQFAAYISQQDKHYATLTVKETLEFAHEFCGGEITRRGEELLSQGTPEENKAALEAARAMFKHYPEIIIEQLGLQSCQNTIVGNAMVRGVSGGECKRVTTGEMEFGMKYVTFMDEISTGLDSAATFDIVNTQRSVAKKFRKTVVIALLQPSPEVLALFDDILIMNEGHVVYYGPREQVVGYFESLGFVCPPDRDLADYLLDLGTSEQYRYQVSAVEKHPRYAGEFAEMYRCSAIHTGILRELKEPHHPDLLRNVVGHIEKMPEFHLSFAQSLWTLIRRESLVLFRNKHYLTGRATMILINGFLYATTFWQFDPTDVQVVLGVMFASILFLSMAQGAQIPSFMTARDIFYKQRRANFFQTAAYVVGSSWSRLPLAVLETAVFGSILYWACGFESRIGGFLRYELIVFLSNLAFTSWFFFIASVTPNVNVGNPLAMVSVLIFIIFAGFIVTKGSIPDNFIWLYWISPMSWSLRAVAVNQYRAASLDVCIYKDVNYCGITGMTMGKYYLSLFGIPSEKYWVSYGMLVLVLLYFCFMFLAYLALEHKRYESPENVVIEVNDKQAGQQKETEDEVYTSLESPKNSGTLLSSNEVMVAIKDYEKNFVPVTIAFQDLWYSVPNPANPKKSMDLLKGISGYAVPGSVTALMGSSGAGKTTLMDVIAGRKTGGKVQGKIFLNAYEANDLAIRRCTGYCEQIDIHSETATIREALVFSAFLRQDASISASKKYDSVNECLELLGLRNIADQMIRGSSVEQLKRLTIAVELAAQPSVIFLDEPTSGLDARSAKKVMDGVRKVANTGRTIVCTIHQPSSEVFFLFDRLLLLKRGGETVYFGDVGKNGCTMVQYFESIPGVEPLSNNYNPAAWMLECIGAGVNTINANDTDFAKLFQQSESKAIMDAAMRQEGVTLPSPLIPELIFSRKRAASSYTQMVFLVDRFFKMYWRTASYNITRFVISATLAILVGLVFLGGDYTSFEGINSGVGMVFVSALFNGLISLQSVIPVATDDRPAFYRERASQTYNAFWYFVGSTLVEIPYIFASALLFTVIFFPMVGFTGFWIGVQFWLALSLLVLMQNYMGMFFAYALPTGELAVIIGVLVNTVFLLFMGFCPPANAIPDGYKWLFHITPQRFPLSIMMSLVFCGCSVEPTWDNNLSKYVGGGPELGCQQLTNAPVTVGHITVKDFVERVFLFKHDQIGVDFVVMIGYIIFFRTLGFLALRYINHQKR